MFLCVDSNQVECCTNVNTIVEGTKRASGEDQKSLMCEQGVEKNNQPQKLKIIFFAKKTTSMIEVGFAWLWSLI
jgi:hypothetical protein